MVTKLFITRMFKSNSGEPYAGKLHVRFLEEFVSNCLIMKEGENLLMRLLYVTDNGFTCQKGLFKYSAPNYAHMHHLSKYFDEFNVIARKDTNEKGYMPISKDYKCTIELFDRYDIKGVKSAVRSLIDEVDAVICYGTNGYFASTIARKKRKVVISYSGGDPYEFLLSRRNLKGLILAPIGLYTHKKMFKNSDFGHYCDDFLFERYPASGPMMACSGVSIDYEKKNIEKRILKIKRTSARKKLGLIGHTKNNLKGIDIAIKALSQLGENYSLEIVGRGEYTEYKKMAQSLGCADQIEFLGTLAPGKEIFDWLDQIDIYIQPSRIEGLPRATIEAMSRGCPIVASNAGAMEKLLEKECIVPIEDVESLVKKIIDISDQDKMMTYAKRNFNAAYEYSTEVRDRKYDEFYGKVVNECKKRKSM